MTTIHYLNTWNGNIIVNDYDCTFIYSPFSTLTFYTFKALNYKSMPTFRSGKKEGKQSKAKVYIWK